MEQILTCTAVKDIGAKIQLLVVAVAIIAILVVMILVNPGAGSG